MYMDKLEKLLYCLSDLRYKKHPGRLPRCFGSFGQLTMGWEPRWMPASPLVPSQQ
jgi:hypothetical protein